MNGASPAVRCNSGVLLSARGSRHFGDDRDIVGDDWVYLGHRRYARAAILRNISGEYSRPDGGITYRDPRVDCGLAWPAAGLSRPLDIK